MPDTIKLPTLKCLRCGHEWIPRTSRMPKTCPNKGCNSPYWDRPYTKPGFPRARASASAGEQASESASTGEG